MLGSLTWIHLSSYLSGRCADEESVKDVISLSSRAHVNVFLGFVLVIWVLTPILYYTNTWNALKMPIISNLVFDRDGHYYDTPTVLGRNRHLNLTAFELYGKSDRHMNFCLIVRILL